MKWTLTHAVSAVLALALAAALAGQADAACDAGQRLGHQHANCLDASWKNGPWYKSSSVAARNDCSNLGKVAVKVDRENGPDLTWHLTDNDIRRSSSRYKIKWVYCCEDLSDLCNGSDIVNVTSCLERFKGSDAGASCSGPAASVDTDYRCKFTASCEKQNGESRNASATVSWRDVDDLHNCAGHLEVGECDSQPDQK